MDIIHIAIGLALLSVGRQLFWLFVAGLGCVYGMQVAMWLWQGHPQWVVLLIGLGAGLLGALCAIVLQRIAALVAGFMAGSYALVHLLQVLGWATGPFVGGLVLLGGIVGGVLMALYFDWALIILSALMGATLIAAALPLRPVLTVLVTAVFWGVGIAVQARVMPRQQP